MSWVTAGAAGAALCASSRAFWAETAAQSAGTGATAETVSTTLSGLASSTTYHYRLVAVNAGGTALGADHTFTTPTPPTATTGGASSARTTSAVLNGTVNPQGQRARYFFQYGPTTAYGVQTPGASAGSGTSIVAVHAFVGDLTPNTTYHYRLLARNADGTADGADRTFTTAGRLPPALNGVPSQSTLDVWWVEGCVEGHTGWEIGSDSGLHGNAANASDALRSVETFRPDVPVSDIAMPATPYRVWQAIQDAKASA